MTEAVRAAVNEVLATPEEVLLAQILADCGDMDDVDPWEVLDAQNEAMSLAIDAMATAGI